MKSFRLGFKCWLMGLSYKLWVLKNYLDPLSLCSLKYKTELTLSSCCGENEIRPKQSTYWSVCICLPPVAFLTSPWTKKEGNKSRLGVGDKVELKFIMKLTNQNNHLTFRGSCFLCPLHENKLEWNVTKAQIHGMYILGSHSNPGKNTDPLKYCLSLLVICPSH